jgi:hypothetical protein
MSVKKMLSHTRLSELRDKIHENCTPEEIDELVTYQHYMNRKQELVNIFRCAKIDNANFFVYEYVVHRTNEYIMEVYSDIPISAARFFEVITNLSSYLLFTMYDTTLISVENRKNSRWKETTSPTYNLVSGNVIICTIIFDFEDHDDFFLHKDEKGWHVVYSEVFAHYLKNVDGHKFDLIFSRINAMEDDIASSTVVTAYDDARYSASLGDVSLHCDTDSDINSDINSFLGIVGIVGMVDDVETVEKEPACVILGRYIYI